VWDVGEERQGLAGMVGLPVKREKEGPLRGEGEKGAGLRFCHLRWLEKKGGEKGGKRGPPVRGVPEGCKGHLLHDSRRKCYRAYIR